MIVYFSTVRRAAAVERGGELVKLDWTAKRVVARAPVVPRQPPVVDPNPRGNARGGRGVLLTSGRVIVASYHTLHAFDHALSPVQDVSHPLFAGLHELAFEGEDLWVTATAIDLALRIRLDGSTSDAWWGREDPVVAERFGVTPLELDKDADNRLRFLTVQADAPHHLHLNAVAIANGRPLMLLSHYGALVRLRPTEVVVADPTLEGCHNVLPLADGSVLINDTVKRAVRQYAADGRLMRSVDVTGFPMVRRFLRANPIARLASGTARLLGHVPFPDPLRRRLQGRRVARPGFVRGLSQTPAGTILVGISPATILEIDWPGGRLVDAFTHSQDVRCAIHGLACMEE